MARRAKVAPRSQRRKEAKVVKKERKVTFHNKRVLAKQTAIATNATTSKPISNATNSENSNATISKTSKSTKATNSEVLSSSKAVSQKSLKRRRLSIEEHSDDESEDDDVSEVDSSLGAGVDDEMLYLEQQLGLCGADGSKKRAKLIQELAALEGFDDDFLTFTDNCLKPGVPETQKRNSEGDFDDSGSEGVVSSRVGSDDDVEIQSEIENADSDGDTEGSDGVEMSEGLGLPQGSGVEEGSGVEDSESSESEDDDDSDVEVEEQGESVSASCKTSAASLYSRLPEDAEMKYLEEQLGLGGPDSSKKKEKLRKELSLLDGLDADMLSFIEDCSNPRVTKFKESDAECSEVGSSVEEVGSSGVGSSDDEDSNAGDEAVESECDVESEREIDNPSTKISTLPTPAPTNTSKYIPPALRAKLQASTPVQIDSRLPKISEIETEALHHAVTSVTTKITGFINRISEGNLRPLTSQISEEYFVRAATLTLTQLNKKRKKQKSTELTTLPAEATGALLSLLSSRLSEAVIKSSVDNLGSTTSLIGSQTAVIAALSSRTSYRVCQQHIVHLVAVFDRHWKDIEAVCLKLNELPTHQTEDSKIQDALMTSLTTTRTYLRFSVVSFSLLFDFGILDSSALFSFIRRLFSNFSTPDPLTSSVANPWLFETQADLLLTCLRHTGVKLRSEFPSDLKDILVFLFRCIDQFELAVPRKESNDRLSFLLRELEDLKNGKSNLHSSDRLGFVRSWLATDIAGVDWSSLRFVLTTTKNMKINKGSLEAWIAVSGGRELPECPESQLDGDVERIKQFSKQLEGVDLRSQLLQLAEEQRLHTDLQKNIFLALMSADSVQQAVQQVLEVANQRHQVQHVVAVVLHTCLRQRVFNAFFAEALCVLCRLPSSIGKRFQRATKQGVSAQLSISHQFSLRAIKNFAKCIGHLCFSPGNLLELRCIRFLKFDDSENEEKFGFFIHQLCLDCCRRESSENDESFESQFRSLKAFEDISEKIVFITRAMVLPTLKKELAENSSNSQNSKMASPNGISKTKRSISMDRAKRVISILTEN